jgi:hypothetical protein
MFNKIYNKFFAKKIDNVNTFKKEIINIMNKFNANDVVDVKVVYVKDSDKKHLVVKEAAGITNVSYRALLDERLKDLDKLSYKYKLIKKHINKNNSRAWGENKDNKFVSYGRKKYLALMVKNSKVISGEEHIVKKKKLSESDKVCAAAGFLPRNVELKHIAKININGIKLVNTSLNNKIKLNKE